MNEQLPIFFIFRRLYDAEKQAIADHLHLMLDCQMKHVYPEGIKNVFMRHNSLTAAMPQCSKDHFDDECSDRDNTIAACESLSINKRFEEGCYNAVVKARLVRIDNAKLDFSIVST